MPARVLGGRSSGGASGLSDTFGPIGIKIADSLSTPSDALTSKLNVQLADDWTDPVPPTFHNMTAKQLGTTQNTVQINKPTATVDGDLLLAFIGVSGVAAVTITAPAGWTQIGTTQTVSDTTLGLVLTTGCYAKIAAGEGANWTWNLSANTTSQASSVLAFTAPTNSTNALPTIFATASSGNNNRTTTQSYGSLSNTPTGRLSAVGMMSLTQTHANAGWSNGPINLTDRTGDTSPSGTNNADHQAWTGLNGTAAGAVTKTEADVYVSWIVELIGTPLAPSESLKLRIGPYNDSLSTPTDSLSTKVKVWLSGTAQVSTNGVTNPANANGQNDGAVATYQSQVAGDAHPLTTSVLGANVPTATITSAVLRCWFKSVNTLVTSLGQILLSSTGALFPNTSVFTNSALNTTVDHLTGDFTFDLLANGINTLAKIQSIVFNVGTTDAVAGVTPHVFTLDAAAIELTGVF